MPHARSRWNKGTRYYEAEPCVDLFGTPCLRVTWGRIGTAYGRQLTRPFDSSDDVIRALAAIANKRARRGYLPAPD